MVGVVALAGCRSAPVVRTTDAGIALSNLHAMVEARERELAVGQTRAVPELIELRLMRGQFLARVSDYERAAVLAGEWVVRAGSADSFLARARTGAALHQFAAAQADLRMAGARGGDPDAIDSARAAVLQAVGRYEEALRIRRRLVRLRADVTAVGAEAAVLAEQGRLYEAVPRFRQAREAYRDASPFPLAWLEFQEGRMWMRLGELDRARERLLAAHLRLPSYVAATAHLGEVEAALGHRDRAIELLSTAAVGAEDPDPAGQLARVLAEAGRTSEAARWREWAAARYGDLLARHGDAFSDHAAEFWLGAGGEPRRALELARRNAMKRPTPWAFDLIARTAAAAGESAAACQAVRAAESAGHPRPQEMRALVPSC